MRDSPVVDKVARGWKEVGRNRHWASPLVLDTDVIQARERPPEIPPQPTEDLWVEIAVQRRGPAARRRGCGCPGSGGVVNHIPRPRSPASPARLPAQDGHRTAALSGRYR